MPVSCNVSHPIREDIAVLQYNKNTAIVQWRNLRRRLIY